MGVIRFLRTFAAYNVEDQQKIKLSLISSAVKIGERKGGLMFVIYHYSSEELRNQARYEKKAKIRTKLYAIAMAQELKAAKDINAY